MPRTVDVPKGAARYLKTLRSGRAAYKRADKILDRLLPFITPGQQITLPDGRKVTVVNNFKDRNKVFKGCFICFIDIKDEEATD